MTRRTKAVRRSSRTRGPRLATATPETPSVADVFREALGWKPGQGTPFHTTARRKCGGCREIKPGAEFDCPITPGRPDLNLCRQCSG